MLTDYASDSLNESARLNDSRLNESINGSRGKKKRTFEDYEFIVNENSRLKTSDLGKGSYGTVKKVKDKINGKIYAMKIMNKKGIFEYSSKENLKREITIQREIVHPNIVRLYTYFEDTENVYLVLEYAGNGSLFHYLRGKKKFTEKEAFVYFFQTCLGIDYLHKCNIIHRDLKPENLLLDAGGNIKICDFGWSADTSSKRQTFCGTVDYMAPEMIKNQSHDHRLDIWCLGILLYEMLHGCAPYKGRNDQEKCRNISMNMPIDFDPSLSSEAMDLIRKILQPAPINRISMYELFNHPWMKKSEKHYNIDVMSFVQQQDEQIRENQKNGSLVLDKSEKYSLETSQNKESAKNAKIITVIDNSPPIKLPQQLSTQYINKPSYSNGSTQASETNSIGSEHLSQSARLNYLIQEYDSPKKPQRLVGSQDKKLNFDDYSSSMYKSTDPAISGTRNISVDLTSKLYIHNEAARQEDINSYVKNITQRQKTSQIEKMFGEYGSSAKLGLTSSSPDKHKYTKSITLNGNSPNFNYGKKSSSFYEDDDEDIMNRPRASRISKRNVGADSINHREAKDKKEASFLESIFAGFTCLSRDVPKK